MKKIMLIAVSLLIIVLISSIAFAYPYPIIISEQGVNHTQAKQLVYSIPQQYYKFVNVIEFVKKPINCKIIDKYGQEKCFMGWSKVYWNSNHQCYNGRIILQNSSLLIHELGHIYDFCINKVNISTEEFANNFMIK